MDIFKLAFETTIVGLLTFLWLGLATYFLFPDKVEARLFPDKQNAPSSPTDSKTSDKSNAALGVGALILAYCLGSAILPISNQFVNDEHWPLNENAIRCQVFLGQAQNLQSIGKSTLSNADLLLMKPDHCSYWAPVFYPTKKEKEDHPHPVRRFLKLWFRQPGEDGEKEPDEQKTDRILTFFQQQEATVLNLSQNTENTERLRQLHERIVVLRGLVFSLFIVCMMSIFAVFARLAAPPPRLCAVRGQDEELSMTKAFLLALRLRYCKSSRWIKMIFGILLAGLLMVFSIMTGFEDFTRKDIFDIPVLEALLTVISTFGVVVLIKGIKAPHFSLKCSLLLSLFVLFFAGLAYGGWTWSEVLYDQQVINVSAVLPK